MSNTHCVHGHMTFEVAKPKLIVKKTLNETIKPLVNYCLRFWFENYEKIVKKSV